MSVTSLSSAPSPALAAAPTLATKIGRFAFTAAVALAYAMIFAPVMMVVLISVFNQEIVTFPPEGLTLRWYVNAWARATLPAVSCLPLRSRWLRP